MHDLDSRCRVLFSSFVCTTCVNTVQHWIQYNINIEFWFHVRYFPSVRKYKHWGFLNLVQKVVIHYYDLMNQQSFKSTINFPLFNKILCLRITLSIINFIIEEHFFRIYSSFSHWNSVYRSQKRIVTNAKEIMQWHMCYNSSNSTFVAAFI